jgi:hypothetical protein
MFRSLLGRKLCFVIYPQISGQVLIARLDQQLPHKAGVLKHIHVHQTRAASSAASSSATGGAHVPSASNVQPTNQSSYATELLLGNDGAGILHVTFAEAIKRETLRTTLIRIEISVCSITMWPDRSEANL